MAVYNNKSLLNRHAFLRLHLHHAATGVWPCNHKTSKPSNILFTVIDCSDDENSFIRDTVCDKVLPIRKNSSYFLPCNRMLHWKLSPEVKFISIHFNLEFFYGFDIFQNYPECIAFEDSRWVEPLQLLGQEKPLLTQICNVNTVLYELAEELYRLHPMLSEPDMIHWERYKMVIEYVRTQGNAGTRVEDLADIMKVRSNVFSRNFTRDLGITPKDFLVNALLRKASDLLALPGNSVKTVAQTLNFSSEYYFSTFFKKHTGQSPRDFKQQNILTSN